MKLRLNLIVIAVAASEGATSVPISESDVIAMQANLSANGFSANPQDLAGDVIVNMQGIRDSFYSLGAVLQNPVIFNPGFSVAGASITPAAIGNSMAQVFDTQDTIQLGNPLVSPTPTLINVVVRRIDLPADWTVSVSPAQVSLNTGQQTTITVKAQAGSPLPQGSTPKVAIEGYAGATLLGGVVVEVLVPTYAPFDGKLHVYLPMIRK